MAVIETWYNQDLSQPVNVHYLKGNVFSQDNDGNTIGVNVFENGEPASLSGTVSASVIRADGATVAVSGTLSGNQCSVVLPQAAYYVPGVLSIAIKLTSGTTVTTLCAVVANVYRSATDATVDPGTIIPDVSALISSIETAIGSIPADYSSLLATIAADYSSSKTYPVVGTYAWYDGVLKRSIVPITTAESYTAAHWTNAVIGDDITDLKSALVYNTGNQKYTYISNKFIYTNSSPVNIHYQEGASGYAYAIADCVAGDVFYVSGRGSLYAALWTFIDSSGVIKSQSTSTTEVTNTKITAPTGATKLIAQTNKPNPKLEKGLPLVSRVSALENEFASTDEYIDAIKIFEQHGNILGGAVASVSGGYYYRSGTSLVTGSNASYDGFIVPVNKNKLYTMTTANVVLLDESKKPLAGSGYWDYESVTSCSSGNASYFALSYRLDAQPQDGYAISEGTAVSYETYAVDYYAKTKSTDFSHTAIASGEIASGGYLTAGGYTSIKDDEQIVFKGTFSSFDSVKIDFYGSGSTNHVTVNDTNLVIVNTTDNTITQPHGLTIANEITILCELKDGKNYISVTSMGVTYKYDCTWNQTGATPTKIYARAVNMAFTSAKLSIAYTCATKDIWYFGDSYIAFGTDTRIPYYMDVYGYTGNVLWNGVSGGTTAVALTCFNELLKYGKPKYAILATGMNDGSDGDTAVYGWITRVPTFISICESNGIVPILCTVPTVPSVNNEKKNAWVRSSGKRYINYASAVGANSSGVWYTGMLSNDNVHPSALGGNALFTQLLVDVPEVMGN